MILRMPPFSLTELPAVQSFATTRKRSRTATLPLPSGLPTARPDDGEPTAMPRSLVYACSRFCFPWLISCRLTTRHIEPKQLERWEASVKDYELLVQENLGDHELAKALSEAQAMLKKKQDEQLVDTARG